MSTSDSLTPKKFFSDEEKSVSFKNYVKLQKEKIQEKFKSLTYSTDHPFSMTDGDLFAKFSREYIKNIIFEKKNLKCKENVQFNFFDYVQLFTESEHSSRQKTLFENIIGFKNEKTNKENYLNVGDFDLIIDTIKGSVILDSLNDHKYNIYHYPGEEIKKDSNYCIICEVKSNFFRQIKEQKVQKQLNKYKIILELLSSKPNLQKIKEKIEINGNNELIFMLVTNGDYYQFDYMRYSSLHFKEDNNNNTDTESKYNLPDYLKNIDEIAKLKIPVLLLFVPRTLDDNGSLYKNKYVTKIEEDIIDLKKQVNELREEINKLKNKDNLNTKEEKEEECGNELLNKKRERSGDDN